MKYMVKRTLNRLLEFLIKNWSIILVVIIGLFPVLFYKSDLILGANESYKTLDLNNYLKNYDWYTWRDSHNTGEHNIWIPHLIVFDLFFYITSYLGSSIAIANIIWFVFLWLASGLAMYFLVKTVAGKYNYKTWGFFSVFLYTFNTFVMIKPFEENFRLVYIGLPLAMALFIRGIKKIEKSTKYAILIGFTSLIFASSSVNPPAVSIIWILLLLYFFFDIAKTKKNILKKFFFGIKILIAYILLNLWWMVPTIPGMIYLSDDYQKAMTFSSLDTKVSEIFRFLGMWAFKENYKGVDYFPYFRLYYDNIFIILSSYLILVTTMTTLFIKKKSKPILFFLFLMVISIFFIKGTSAPFGDLYNFLWKNVPGIWVFREPYVKFTPLLVFSVSLCFGYIIQRFLNDVDLFYKNNPSFKFKIKALIVALSVLVIFAASFPFFSKQLFREKSEKEMKSQYFKFPQYWLDAGAWFNKEDKEGRILVLPKTDYGVPYAWKDGYSSAGPTTPILIPNPALSFRGPTSNGEYLTNMLFRQIVPEAKNNLVLFMRYLGIKYILQQNDVDWTNALKDTYSPEVIKDIIEKQEGIDLIKKFGKLDIYKIKDSYFLPMVYSPKEIVCTERDPLKMPDLILKESSPVSRGIFFKETICQKDLFSLDVSPSDSRIINSQNIKFERISPAKYKVSIIKNKAPFLLILSTDYSPLWKAYILNNKKKTRLEFTETFFSKSLDEMYHSRVNNFANSWWIDADKLEEGSMLKKDADGSYNFEIILEYWPQKSFHFGILISVISGLVGIFYLVFSKKRSIIRKRINY